MLIYFLIATLIVLADIATKAVVLAHLSLEQSIEVTSFFNIVYVLNKGVSFSMLSKWSSKLQE